MYCCLLTSIFKRLKVKKEVIVASLRRQNDKEKVLNMRQSHLEESMKHQALLTERNESIRQMEKSLNEAVTEVKNKELEVKHLSHYIGK